MFLLLKQPNILLHPVSLSTAPGTEAVFKVTATGDCLQFQWQKDCKDLCDGSKYRGTNIDELSIKDVKKSDKGCYQCLVKNYVGEKLSEEAVFTISKLVINVVYIYI